MTALLLAKSFALALCLSVATASPYSAPGVPRAPMFVLSDLDDAGLSANAFRVLGRVYRRWHPERGCYESKAEMRRGCRLGKDAFYSALNELEDRRFIRRSGRGPGARIDWRPPSDWLDEAPGPPAEFVRDRGTNGLSGSGDETPEVCPDPGTKVCPDPRDKGLSGSRDHKGIPPKGVHEGTQEETTAIGPDLGSADRGGVPGAAVVLDGDGKAADPDRDAKNRAWRMLMDRRVAQAEPLAAEHWRHVPAAVEVYDRGLADGSIGGPGWFAGALPGWRTPTVAPAKQAATHTGRTPEQERGTRQGVEAAREIAAGDVPGTPGSPAVAAAMAEARTALEDGARRKAEAAEDRRQRRRAARRAAAGDVPPPLPPAEVPPLPRPQKPLPQTSSKPTDR